MEDNMLHVIQEGHTAQPEIYRLGKPIRDDFGIVGYTECVKIVEWDGKKMAFGGSWIPAHLVVRKYGTRCRCEEKKAQTYNLELDELLVKEAEIKASWDEYAKNH